MSAVQMIRLHNNIKSVEVGRSKENKLHNVDR